MPTQVKIADGTLITPTITSLANLGAGGVAQSAEIARGDMRDEWVTARLVIKGFAVGATVGQTVDLYAYTSRDGSQGTRDGNLDGTDSVLTGPIDTETLPNLRYICSAVVITTTAGDEIKASAVVRLPEKYIGVCVHNNTDQDLSGNAHEVTLEPYVPTI